MSVSDKSGSLDDILVRLAELEKLKDQFDIREVIEAYVHGCDRAARDGGSSGVLRTDSGSARAWSPSSGRPGPSLGRLSVGRASPSAWRR